MPQTGSTVVGVAIVVSSWFSGVTVFAVWVAILSCTCGVTSAGPAAGSGAGCQRRSRLALVTTDSDDRAIAAAAVLPLPEPCVEALAKHRLMVERWRADAGKAWHE